MSGRDPRIPYELDEGYAATFARMRRMFRARGFQPEEAADLAQEAIARALLHIKRNGCDPTFDGVGPLLKRIGMNLLIDRARASRLRIVSIESTSVEEFEADPTDEFERRVDQAELHSAIKSLSSRHQHAMMMSLNGHSPAEIAANLGIERNAADALLHRARRRLAERLRSAGHAVRVLVFVALMRARSGARRAGVGVEQAAASPLAMNFAAAAFAAALAIGAPIGATADTPRPATLTAATSEAPEAAAPRDAVPSDPVAASAEKAGGDGGGTKVTADVDPDEHHVRVGGSTDNPATGQEEEVLAEVWHEKEEQDRGLTGPLMDEATDNACGLTAAPGC